MPDEIETPPAFVPYTVPGVGTVTAHEGDTYVVLTDGGRVYGYRSQSGEPSEAAAAAEIAHAIANPPAFPQPPRRQSTRTIIDRLTDAERTALYGSTVTAVRVLLSKAEVEGAIRDDDQDFPTAVAGLDALGIIAASRWDALLAP